MKLFGREPSAREYRDAWLKYMDDGAILSPKTIEGYRATTEKLLKRYPKTKLAKFTEDNIIGIIEESKPGSRQRSRAPFTNWFAWAYRKRFIKHNPMDHVPKYKQPEQKHPDPFSDAEWRILAALPHPDGVLMDLMLSTGIRKSEARMLTVRRIDLESGYLHVVEGAKGGHSRIVPIYSKLAQRLAEYLTLEGLNPDDHVWYTHLGGRKQRSHLRPLSETAMQSWWKRCAEAAGVPYRNMHATRHTHATYLRRAGVDMADVGSVLGHRDLKTTKQVYDHTTIFDVRRRSEVLLPEEGLL